MNNNHLFMTTKKLMLVVIIMLMCVLKYNKSYSQIEHEMVQINENTHKTAENTSKGYIEYITFGVSILACIVAGVTLIYAYKTYKSQKQTEKNTRRWSAKQERVVLRQIGWKLFMSYAKLLSIEKAMNMHYSKKLSSTNFLRMKVDPADLHLNDCYECIKDFNDLGDLYNEIVKLNSLLDRRIDQTDHLMIKKCSNAIETYVDSSYTKYFTEEKQIVRSILNKIDSIYPYFFESNEIRKVSDSTVTKVSIVKSASKLYDPSKVPVFFREQYYCKSEIPLSSFDSLLNTEEADKYFPIPYISFYNCVINSRNKSKSGIVDDLLDNSPMEQSHKLPLKKDYFEMVLKLVEEDLLEGLDNLYFSDDKDRILEDSLQLKEIITQVLEQSRFKKEDLISVFDESSNTLYTYVDKKQFQSMVSFKQNHFTMHIAEKDLPLYFKHENGQIICSEDVIDRSFIGCINQYRKDGLFPYTKKEIKRLSVTFVTEVSKDTALFNIKKVRYSLSANKDQWKAVILLGDLIQFIRH